MPTAKDSSRNKYLRLLRGKEEGYDTGRHSSALLLFCSCSTHYTKSDSTHALPDKGRETYVKV